MTEPDGAPNAAGIPLTTLHGNIWYHLGLAYYLNGDMKNARRCYDRRVGNHKYDDNVVSTGHWSYMIRRRMGDDNSAQEVVAPVRSEMKILENQAYHRICLFYKGEIGIEDLAVSVEAEEVDDVHWYSVANWLVYDQNDQTRAKEIYKDLA